MEAEKTRMLDDVKLSHSGDSHGASSRDY